MWSRYYCTVVLVPRFAYISWDLDIYISDKISAAAAAAAAAAANISMLFGYEKELRICYEYIYDTPNNPHIS